MNASRASDRSADCRASPHGARDRRRRTLFKKVARQLRRCGISAVRRIQNHPGKPQGKRSAGRKVYARLEDIPETPDIVDIFRRSEAVPEIVDSAIRLGAKAVWMQEGVVNEEAAARARSAGLLVVQDTCILREHHRLMK